MFTQNNNSLPNIRRNSVDFVDVLHKIAWLSCTCVCFRSLLLAWQCVWNEQGAGLVGGNNREGSASRMSAQSGPLTKSGPLADSERTQSGLLADPKRTHIFEKRTRSGPKANLGSAFGVRFGVRLGPVDTVCDKNR